MAERGATVAFGVPGGGPNLDVVGAMESHGIRFVLAHSETAAAIMASTWGGLSGSATAVVVTRGPGAASVVNGAAQATLDRQPLLVVTDTVPNASRDRVPHQRLDQQAMFGPVTKASGVLGSDASVGAIVNAIDLASATPAGAVHLDYDASASTTLTPGGAIDTPDLSVPTAADTTTVDDEGLKEARALVAAAERPVVIVGSAISSPSPSTSPASSSAKDSPRSLSVEAALQAFGAPVLTTYQAVGLVPSESEINGGLFTNGMSERPLLDQADLILSIGLDVVEPIPAAWTYSAPVVAIGAQPMADPYLPVELELIGDVADLTHRVLVDQVHRWEPGAGSQHREQVRRSLAEGESSDTFGPLALTHAVSNHTPGSATVTVDAGAHFLAIMPSWPVAEPQQLLISNGLATMGYAVPAAIGAALARPGEPVVALTGDGGLGMCLAELETIVRLGLPIVVVVFNDSELSLIRIKQGVGHGGDPAVRYGPTDFAALAHAMGMPSAVVSSPSDVGRELDQHRFDHPLLLDARIDPSSYPHLLQVSRG